MRKTEIKRVCSDLQPFYTYIVGDLFPAAQLKGAWYRVGSILGEPGDSLGVNIQSGQYKDFKTGEYGDIVGLYARCNDIPNAKAAQTLKSKYLSGRYAPIKDDSKMTDTEKRFPVPPPDGALPTWSDCTFYPYRDKTGKLIYCVMRKEATGDQKKKILPMYYSGRESKWKCGAYPDRVLYNLDKLDSNPDNMVIVVEGEKCADALTKVANGHPVTVTTWAGGVTMWSKTDLKPLAGKRVLLWPDNDDSGHKEFSKLSERLSTLDCKVKMVKTSGKPSKWDVADAIDDGWGWNDITSYCRNNLIVATQVNLNLELGKPTTRSTTSELDTWRRLGIQVSERGQPICNEDTALLVLEHSDRYKGKIWFDIFEHVVMFDGRPLRDRDYGDVLKYCHRTLSLHQLKKHHVIHAVHQYAEDNERNEPLHWIKQRVWDGVDRIETFFPACFGCPDTPYTRAVSKNFWLSMVARVVSPGCWCDNMVIIEGSQNIGKTKALKLIGGKWYKTISTDAMRKDFVSDIQGGFLIEIGELSAFTKADSNSLKHRVSTEEDVYRRPYARNSEKLPRQCILVGTTNDDHYLKDPTGARRFWPIEATKADWDYIKESREQLFAEALARFEDGETWWLVPDSATGVQDARFQVDVWEPQVRHWLKLRQYTTETEVLVGALQFELNKVSQREASRVKAIMRRLGWRALKDGSGRYAKEGG